MKNKVSARLLIAGLLLLSLLSASANGHAGDARLPRPDHIVIVIEENHGYSQIIGNDHAPYINQLAKEGALFTDAHGEVHPSQPNYIAFFSGSLQGVKNDHCQKDRTPFTTPDLGAALIAAGYTFEGYAQTMPHEGFMGCHYARSKSNGGYLYGRKHCPWVNWIGEKTNDLPASASEPFTKFPANYNKLPTVSFVIPDMDHDMHNNGGDQSMIVKADQWLKDHLSKYVHWAKTHNSIFILTFDEDNMTPQNHIPTLIAGAHVKAGRYDMHINHYNILRTIESMYRLQPSGDVRAAVITGIWK